MLITKAHLLVLQELANSEAVGHAVRSLAEDDPQEHIYRELELQGLLLLEVPRAYRLTYAGREALGILEAMRKAAGQAQGLHSAHPHPPLLQFNELKNDWRFLGSDILAALHAAQRKGGRVGPLTAQVLSARGLTENVHDTLEKRSFMRLNQYGEAWLDFANHYRPRLEINGDLANSIRHMHSGYTGGPDIHMPDEQIPLLEAMDLLTWSVPERTIYALTELGRAVYEALLKEGYASFDRMVKRYQLTGPGRFSLDHVLGIRPPRALVFAIAIVEAAMVAIGIASRPTPPPTPSTEKQVPSTVTAGQGC